MKVTTLPARLAVLLILVIFAASHAAARDFQNDRRAIYNPFVLEGWDYVWDGQGTVSLTGNPYYTWDNPVDDDWKLLEIRQGSFIYNSLVNGGVGLTVDRVGSAAGSPRKTGHVWRTDERLSFSTGVTFEVELELYADSAPRAVMLSYSDEQDGFSFVISPDRVDYAPFITYSAQYFNHSVPFNAARKVVYRLVKAPNSHNVELYADGNPAPLLAVTATSGRKSSLVCAGPDPSSRCLESPMLDLGDNSNDPALNGHFTLSRMQYRRGAAPPGHPLPPLPPRAPAPLPPPSGGDVWSGAALTRSAPDLDALSPYHLPEGENWLYTPTGAYRGLQALAKSGSPEAFVTAVADDSWSDPEQRCRQSLRVRGIGHGADGGWNSGLRRDGAGNIVVDNLSGRGGSNITVYCPVGLGAPDGVTLETRLRIDPASEEGGFQIEYLDRHGQVNLVFSPDKVELAQGTKPTGFIAHPLDATRETTYRLVRPTGSRLFYLYVNNGSIPVITDYHPGADFQAGAQIVFGALGLQSLDMLRAGAHQTARGKASIAYLRWQGKGTGPGQ